MLENILYHTIAVIFIGYLIISLFLLNKKYTQLKVSIVPFMFRTEFILPKDRSLFIRGVRAIEAMLTQKFGIQVYLKYDISRKSFFLSEFECFLKIIFETSEDKESIIEYAALFSIIKVFKEQIENQKLPLKNRVVFFRQKSITDSMYAGINPQHIFHKNDHSIWEISI